MKNLVLSSLCLLLLGGCAASLLNNTQRLPEAALTTVEITPWFQGEDNPVLYKANVDFYRNHFSGLMVIKPVSDESHRVLFITELGIKIFDLELFRNGDYNLHYCLDALNKKSVVRTLKNDLALMIYHRPDKDKNMKAYVNPLNDRIIFRQRTGLGARYYFKRADRTNADTIIQTSCTGKKVNLQFYGMTDNLIDSVMISHYKLKLDIHITALHEK
ncbi:MAG: hypothetical protein JXR41_12275 [Bacteroidales bacterium]|nr:hypothetical protein [Bacteroidales bacterium]MBN2763862.1 hypothetical protein [Bacteroidales bacterium]